MFEQLLLKLPPEALARNGPWLVVKKVEPKRDEFPKVINEYLSWSASWETYMQVRKQQLELDMEQQTGSK